MKYRVIIEYQENQNSPYKIQSETFDDYRKALGFAQSYYPAVYVIYEAIADGREIIIERKGKFLEIEL